MLTFPIEKSLRTQYFTASTYLKKTDDETDKATAFLVDQQPIQAKIHRPRQGIKTRGASSFKTGSTGYSRETFQQTVESSSVTPPVKRGLRTRGGVNSAGPKNTGKRAYNKRKFSESSSSLSNSLLVCFNFFTFVTSFI